MKIKCSGTYQKFHRFPQKIGNFLFKQECIPVQCVSTAGWPYLGGGPAPSMQTSPCPAEIRSAGGQYVCYRNAFLFEIEMLYPLWNLWNLSSTKFYFLIFPLKTKHTPSLPRQTAPPPPLPYVYRMAYICNGITFTHPPYSVCGR